MKRTNNLYLVPKIKYKIDKKIYNLNSIFDNFFFKRITRKEINIFLNQLVDLNINNCELNRSLLNFFSNGEKIKIKLPYFIIDFFSNENIKINRLYSFSAWFFYCFKILIKTYFNFYRILKIKKNQFSNNTNIKIYLDNLNNHNFDSSTEKISDYNIIKFFDKYFENKNKKLTTIFQPFFNSFNYENYNVKKIDIFELNNFFQLTKITIIFHLKFMLSFILIFFGKWQYSLAMCEILKRDIILENNYINCIDYFFFDNTNYLYRPVWTYSVDNEKKFILYYYSSNLKYLDANYNESICFNGYSKMSWSNIFVWNNEQKNFLRKFIDFKDDINFEVMGPIPSNYKKMFLNKNENYVCVFDVQPYNSWIRTGLGLTDDYYSFNNSRLFFEHLIEVCSKLNVKIIFKRKRITENIDDRYLGMIKEFVNQKKITQVNPEISTFEMISNSIGSVTMPFTGAGYIAEIFKKENLFYDPSNFIIDKKVINSKNELENNIIKMISIL